MISPAEASAVIAKLLNGGGFGEWEFLYIDTSAFLRTDVSPDQLRQSYCYKASVRNTAGNQERLWALVKAIRRTTFEVTTGNIDIRYGMIVRDERDKEAVSLFMDVWNRLVVINGRMCHAHGDLIYWFKDLARTVTRAL